MNNEPTLIDLYDYLKKLGSVIVAFSGGVDSSFLIKAAQNALGSASVTGVTVRSAFYPEWEDNDAASFCERYGIKQHVIAFDPLADSSVASNPTDRCYFCKKSIFGMIKDYGEKEGITNILDGANIDDVGDYRPGMRATKELSVISPLKELGFTKSMIRGMSEAMGLPTYDKPSFACLASRFVYGEVLTEVGLQRVERAERILFDAGFRQARVRVHADLARIEVDPSSMGIFFNIDFMNRIDREFKALGYTYVSLDLAGYRSGSMNAGIEKNAEV